MKVPLNEFHRDSQNQNNWNHWNSTPIWTFNNRSEWHDPHIIMHRLLLVIKNNSLRIELEYRDGASFKNLGEGAGSSKWDGHNMPYAPGWNRVTSLFEHSQPNIDFCQRNWSLKNQFFINLRWLVYEELTVFDLRINLIILKKIRIIFFW